MRPRSSGRCRSSIGPRLERLGAEEDRLLHDLARDHVEGPAHVARPPRASCRSTPRSRCARCRGRCRRGGRLSSPSCQLRFEGGWLRDSAYARIPSARARAIVWRYAGVLEAARLVVVGDRGDLREDAGHLGRDEDDERRFLHAVVLEAGHDGLQARDEAALHGLGELPRLAGPRVLEDALEEAAVVRERVARLAVLVARERLEARRRSSSRGSTSRRRACRAPWGGSSRGSRRRGRTSSRSRGGRGPSGTASCRRRASSRRRGGSPRGAP